MLSNEQHVEISQRVEAAGEDGAIARVALLSDLPE